MRVIMSKIYLEILDNKRKQVFQSLSLMRHKGYLGGGTALALQLNHRISYDFDVFVPHEISNILRKNIRDTFPDYVMTYDSHEQITFQTQNVSITFLWYYFQHIVPLVSTQYLPLASILDIAADKAHTLGRRVVWRDYVDIYFLLEQFSLEKIIEVAKKKFNGDFNDALFLEQLVYFKNLEIVPIEYINRPVTEEEIKKKLQQVVTSYIKSKIS